MEPKTDSEGTKPPGPASSAEDAADTVSPTERPDVSAGQVGLRPEPAHAVSTTSGGHNKFADDLDVYMREQIRHADQKATFVFAVFTAVLAYLNAQNVPAGWLKSIQQWSLADCLGFISMFGLAIGAGLLLVVVFPRLQGPLKGMVFFNAVAEYRDPLHYADAVLSSTGEELVRSKLYHCHDLARVCRSKYRLLLVGFWIGSTGAGAALIFLLTVKSP